MFILGLCLVFLCGYCTKIGCFFGRGWLLWSPYQCFIATKYPSSWPTVRCKYPAILHMTRDLSICLYIGCPRRNGQNIGRVFLMLNYTDITQNTCIQSWTVTEIMAIEKCGLLGCPRTLSCPWRHTHPLRMPGNEKPLATIGMQCPWRDNGQLRPA